MRKEKHFNPDVNRIFEESPVSFGSLVQFYAA